MVKIDTLQDLAFACPDGTIGVSAGFGKMEFNCKTNRDMQFVWNHALRLMARKVERNNITLTITL